MLEKNLPECPVETTLLLISNRWKVLILRDLMDGKKRFGELKKSNNERLFYYGYNFIYITGFSHSFAFAKIFYGTVGEMRG